MILNRNRGASKKPEQADIRLDSSSNTSSGILNRLRMTLSVSDKPWLPIAIGSSAVILLIIALSLFFSGSIAPEATDTSQELQQQNKQLEQLLSNAKQALSQKKYVTPDNNNAYYFYQQVLKIEPDNIPAKKGIKKIESQLLLLKQHKPQQKETGQDIGKAIDKTVHGTEKSLGKIDSAPEQKNANLENYSVTVSANNQLEIPGPPGELRVWIGISSNAPVAQPGMIAKTKELESVGETAKVTPFTLGIDVEPKVSVCEKIDPSGSEVRFKLIPSKTGTFTVGANVELYDSGNCSGIPVPKSAKSVEVKVTVDEVKVLKQAIFELIETTWKAFLTFWDKLLLLISALLLFLIRKKLFKWFRFKSDERK